MHYVKPLKNNFITAFMVLSLSFGSGFAFQVPQKLHNYKHYLHQRTLFGKIFVTALWKFATNTNDYTLIERNLMKRYTQDCHTNSAQKSAQKLYLAVANNNPYVTPENFLLGASSSAAQIEGGLDETSAAARFYKKAHLPTPGIAIDFANRSHDDFLQMKNELHINSFRLSISWNRIEPQQGVFSTEGIEFYRNKIRQSLANNIKPMIVFHHYDIPTWFEDLGGFEHQENGRYFQQFCLYVYNALAEELGHCLISMCNAPEGPAFKGYFTGDGTPGEIGNLHKTHTVIANMYYELIDTALEIKKAYKILKKTNPQLKKPFIGTQLNIVPLDPHHTTQHNWKDRLTTAIGCEIAAYIQSGGTYNFLVNGEYRMFTPNLDFMKQAKNVDVYRYHPHAYKAFDWIGVNIYSNNFLQGFKPIPCKDLIEEDAERYTDNANYRNYPEGIYRAVKMVSENLAVPLGKKRNKNGQPLPIIVTENGIATKDDEKRTRYFQRALCTITELIKDGYHVIGYLPWSSHDNYEWPTKDNPEGFGSKCYGFFAVNFDQNSPDYLKRTLKEGSRYYADFSQTFFALL